MATGATRTRSSESLSRANRASATCPQWGGSKLPPNSATRIVLPSYPGCGYAGEGAHGIYGISLDLARTSLLLPEVQRKQSGRLFGISRAAGRVVAQSSLYRTAPVGLHEQPYFINAVLCLETELKPEDLLREMLAIERALTGATARRACRKGRERWIWICCWLSGATKA